MAGPRPIVVFDVDGVLVDVTESYREAVCRTVEHFTGKRIALAVAAPPTRTTPTAGRISSPASSVTFASPTTGIGWPAMARAG